MIVEDIIELSEAHPFVPFEVHLADGESVMVRHPKWMMFSPDFRTLIVVGATPGQRRISVPLITQATKHPEQDPVDTSAALRG
jgi:hypothetical protein